MEAFVHRGVAVALIVMALGLVGCTSGLTGRVISATTNEPISGALVTVSTSTTMTTAGGEFSFGKLDRKTTTGTVTLEGYSPVEFPIDLSNGDGSAVVKLPDSELTVRVEENALEPKPVAVYKLSLDGIVATSPADPIRRLAPGVHALKLEAESHEAIETTITLKPGANTSVMNLSLTPLETYKRFNAAGQFHRDKVVYGYIHSDERKLMTLKKWSSLSPGLETTKITFGDVRMLASWKSGFTKKTYKNVAEIDRTIVAQVVDPKYSDYGQSFTNNFAQHWVKVDGKWYIVHVGKLW